MPDDTETDFGMMPDVIWAYEDTIGNICATPFHSESYKTSYTRTDLLEQRAKVAAEKWYPHDTESGIRMREQLTAIILAARKGEAK